MSMRRMVKPFAPIAWLAAGAGAAAVVACWHGGLNVALPLPHAQTTFNTDLPAVVDRIRDLNRLETASLHVEKVIDARQRYEPLPEWMAGDRVLLAAQGDVTAGVDLATLKPSDVRQSNDGLHIRLPHATIFSVWLDDGSFVYDHSPGLFTGVDRTLETQARLKAEDQIRDVALGSRLLTRADENARARIVDLLRLAGVRQVHFDL